MKPLKKIEQEFWNRYLQSLSPSFRPVNPRVEASYAGNRSIADGLLVLYLCGRKTAGSSIVEDFISAGDPLPLIGNYWIFLNSKDEPSCILRTERVVFNKFKDVPVEIAIAEGEGDLTLEYWRKVHAELYLPHLSNWGVGNLDDATVVTEFFKIVYK
jgi:uncharacterized protein YhfF